MTSSFEKRLNQIIPKNLDEIIREKRDLAKLYLTTENEIAGLTKSIMGVDDVRDQIADWRFVTFDAGSFGSKVMLLRNALLQRQTWITSRVVAIDLSNKIVATKNSVYGLSGEPGKGEPPIEHLLHICAALHGWGSGKTLGVLEVFY